MAPFFVLPFFVLHRSKLRTNLLEPTRSILQHFIVCTNVLPSFPSLLYKDTTPEERPRDELLEFCTEAEIERNPRFRLLQLRSSGAAGFRNFGTVPLLPNEYSVSLIEVPVSLFFLSFDFFCLLTFAIRYL